ncbi:MAG TPA: ATP-binding protein [Roseiflexaceae bacterium]|nr:ATP-binding protein [Roseiflexaceae bacterium]
MTAHTWALPWQGAGETPFQALLEAAPDAMVIVDASGRIVRLNQQAELLLGYDRAELVGEVVELLVPERLRDDHALARKRYESAPHVRRIGEAVDMIVRQRDGAELPVEISLRPLESATGAFIICAIRDVSARKQAEAELRRQSGFVTLLQRVASTANTAASVEAATQQVLAQICEYLGWPVGCAVLFDGDDRMRSEATLWHLTDVERFAPLRESLEQALRYANAGVIAQVRASGRPIWKAGAGEAALAGAVLAVPVLVGVEVVAVLAFLAFAEADQDAALLEVLAQAGTQLGRVVERERIAARLEEQQRSLAERLNATEAGMLQAARLAAVGQLAASIAHEINNPLYAARNCLALLEQEPPSAVRTSPFLNVARDELARIARIIERMREFYRPDRGTLAPCDIHSLLAETLELAELNVHDQSIRVVFSPGPPLPPVVANGDQLRQVFLNLVLNAIEAMPAGGTLTVRSAARPGSVQIDVQDTGAGIPDDLRPRLFEPFFTNKPNGTGLGLSISAHIVTQHSGRIEVDSSPGHGATFRVILPLRADRHSHGQGS